MRRVIAPQSWQHSRADLPAGDSLAFEHARRDADGPIAHDRACGFHEHDPLMVAGLYVWMKKITTIAVALLPLARPPLQ